MMDALGKAEVCEYRTIDEYRSSASCVRKTSAWFDAVPQRKPADASTAGDAHEYDGFVVSLSDHCELFPSQSRPDEPVNGKSGRAERDDASRLQRAFQLASDIGGQVGAEPDDVLLMRRQRDHEAHFGLRVGEDRYFVKTRIDASKEHWAERSWTQWANERGFSLGVLTVPQRPDALLTEWVAGGSLTREDCRDHATRLSLLRRAGEIPRASESRPGPKNLEPDPAANGHWRSMVEQGREGPLRLFDLGLRLSWIHHALEKLPRPEHIAHGDVALPNIVRHRHGYFFIDWENAGWGDSFRDPARLVSHGLWDNRQLDSYLEAYLGTTPTRQQLRHFALLVAQFDIDHYGNHRGHKGPDDERVRDWARRIAAGHDLLPDMPNVRWAAGAQKTDSRPEP